MIRKLRRKFTLVCMLSLLVVLVVILGVVNALNYREIVSDADGVLAMLSAFAGEAPAPPEDFIDWQDAGGRYRSPELPYEIRFFSALLDGDGAVVSTNMERSSPWTRPPWPTMRARPIAAARLPALCAITALPGTRAKRAR